MDKISLKINNFRSERAAVQAYFTSLFKSNLCLSHVVKLKWDFRRI